MANFTGKVNEKRMFNRAINLNIVYPTNGIRFPEVVICDKMEMEMDGSRCNGWKSIQSREIYQRNIFGGWFTAYR